MSLGNCIVRGDFEMKKGAIEFAIGMLVAWALMFFAFIAQLENNLNNFSNAFTVFLVWITLFVAIFIAVVGYLLRGK